MILKLRSQVLSAIFFMIISFIVIIIGLFLTLSIIFIFIGIPILLLGIILFIFSLFYLLIGIFGDLNTVINKFRTKKKYRSNENIIDVTEVNGIYQKK
jgi:Zn-dependent membrane protease YugP